MFGTQDPKWGPANKPALRVTYELDQASINALKTEIERVLSGA